MASGTIYLASALAAGPHAAAARPEAALIAPVVAVQPAGPVAPARNYVIVDIPAFNRTMKSLDAVVGEEVRRTLREGPRAQEIADLSENDPAGVNQAVVSEHDTRIALLRQRIANLRADGRADGDLLGDLRVRLRRAEAARGLAIARAALDPPCVDCALGSAVVLQEVAPRLDTTIGPVLERAPKVRPFHVIAAKQPAKQPGAAKHKPRSPLVAPQLTHAVAEAARPARVAAVTAALLHITGVHQSVRTPRPRRVSADVHAPRFPRPVSPMAAKDRRFMARTAGEATIARKLAGSRALLVLARKALEAEAAYRPHALADVAGLLHFEGSETWSLADLARRRA